MSESAVSTDGVTRELEQPFMVVATQNPHEFEGTFPLPESQLDRFLLRIRIGYPGPDEEKRVLRGQDDPGALGRLEAVLDAPAVLELREKVVATRVDDEVADTSSAWWGRRAGARR